MDTSHAHGHSLGSKLLQCQPLEPESGVSGGGKDATTKALVKVKPCSIRREMILTLNIILGRPLLLVLLLIFALQAVQIEAESEDEIRYSQDLEKATEYRQSSSTSSLYCLIQNLQRLSLTEITV